MSPEELVYHDQRREDGGRGHGHPGRGTTMSNRAITESVGIWREFHEPIGITLAESKEDWLMLLDEDPTMSQPRNWGDMAGQVASGQIAEFREWLIDQEGKTDE